MDDQKTRCKNKSEQLYQLPAVKVENSLNYKINEINSRSGKNYFLWLPAWPEKKLLSKWNFDFGMSLFQLRARSQEIGLQKHLDRK